MAKVNLRTNTNNKRSFLNKKVKKVFKYFNNAVRSFYTIGKFNKNKNKENVHPDKDKNNDITSSISKGHTIVFNENILGLRDACDMYSVKNVVEYEVLNRYSQEYYKEIRDCFPRCIFIKKVEKINNPFLKTSFDLTREFHYKGVTPLRVYHGTWKKYVHDICTYNYDWRLSGMQRGHRYGKGVNFTLNPEFAARFCDPNTSWKVILVTDILVKKAGLGSEDLELPPVGCDTAIREDGKAFVKFSDGEFLPRYIVWFDWNY